jgi:hypothetical protein
MLKNNLFFLAQPARTLTAYRLDNQGSLAAIALYRAMHSSQPAGTRQWIVITSHWEALLSVKKCVLTMCTIILKLILRFAKAQSALRVCKHTSDSYMSKCKVLCPAAQHAMSSFLSYTSTWTLLIRWTRNFVKVTTGNVISHRNIKHTELVTYKNIIRTSHNILKCYTKSIIQLIRRSRLIPMFTTNKLHQSNIQDFSQYRVFPGDKQDLSFNTMW